VVDDGGYGMLRYDQQVDGHEERGVDLVAPDWAVLAAAYGWGFAQAQDAGDGLASVLTDALGAAAAGTPQLVLLRARLFPPRTTSPRWREPA
jgi:thiamine pyrophosphate-dependent acetolactate synthase large subunit-like protein